MYEYEYVSKKLFCNKTFIVPNSLKVIVDHVDLLSVLLKSRTLCCTIKWKSKSLKYLVFQEITKKYSSGIR